MIEPNTIRAGDSVAWTRSVPDCPASDGWSLTYRLIWPNGVAVNILTTPIGAEFSASLTSIDTAGFAVGRATLVSWVTKGEEVYTLGQQSVEILPNLRTATVFDGRSSAEKRLEQARAALDDYMARGKAHVAQYEIGERKMIFRSTKDIVDLISFLEIEVKRERAAMALLDGTGSPGRVHTRF